MRYSKSDHSWIEEAHWFAEGPPALAPLVPKEDVNDVVFEIRGPRGQEFVIPTDSCDRFLDQQPAVGEQDAVLFDPEETTTFQQDNWTDLWAGPVAINAALLERLAAERARAERTMDQWLLDRLIARCEARVSETGFALVRMEYVNGKSKEHHRAMEEAFAQSAKFSHPPQYRVMSEEAILAFVVDLARNWRKGDEIAGIREVLTRHPTIDPLGKIVKEFRNVYYFAGDPKAGAWKAELETLQKRKVPRDCYPRHKSQIVWELSKLAEMAP